MHNQMPINTCRNEESKKSANSHAHESKQANYKTFKH